MTNKDVKQSEGKVEIFESEKDLVLDHDYDGIQELDHPLPFWWIVLFTGTIVFSIPYYFYYTHAGGQDIRATFEENFSKVKKIQADYEAKAGGFDVDAYNAFIGTEEAQKLGAKAYRRQCAACHGMNGEGGIGPNLTDNYWMNGNGQLASVYDVIAKGVPAKGMPAWKQTLDDKQMMAVTAHVLKMKGKNVEGKEAQGELFE